MPARAAYMAMAPPALPLLDMAIRVCPKYMAMVMASDMPRDLKLQVGSCDSSLSLSTPLELSDADNPRDSSPSSSSLATDDRMFSNDADRPSTAGSDRRDVRSDLNEFRRVRDVTRTDSLFLLTSNSAYNENVTLLHRITKTLKQSLKHRQTTLERIPVRRKEQRCIR